jgi:hypothetical protein
MVTSVLGLALMFGCGDDGGGPRPVTGVMVTPGKTDIEIGNSTEITAVVQGGESKNLTWYVNDVENGNTVFGTISENSPVTYTAPDILPYPATVTVKAVSTEDTSKYDTCDINLQFTKIFVDASGGDDDTGTGSINSPLKTITYGLDLAQKGMTVLVQPGVYDQTNGEIFEFVLPESVALVGMDWETCIIRGHGTGSYNATVLMQEPATVFRKFTMEMGEPVDPEWEIAVQVRGDYQLVDSIRVLDRALYGTFRIGRADYTTVQNCRLVVDDGLRWYRGFEIVNNNVDLIIRGNTLSGFNEGIFINNLQDPRIEGCLITGNNYGVNMWYEMPTSNPNPDLGGGARDGLGGNTFNDNTVCGLNNTTTNAIYAKFNTWENDPPVEGVDFCNSGTGGSVITE